MPKKSFVKAWLGVVTIIFLCKTTRLVVLPNITGLSSLGGGGVGVMAPSNFGRSASPYLRQERQIVPTTILLASPDFQTFLRTCIKCTPLGADVEVIQFLGGTLRD